MRNFLLGVLFLTIFSACGAGTTSDLDAINVNPNQGQFTVELPANPTTGFQWQVTNYDHNVLALVSSQYTAGEPHLIGSGGTMQFIFKCQQLSTYPKNTTISFSYLRPWEKDSATEKQIQINFVK